MDFKTDNFDKEFSLNQTRKKTAARGKLPSWLMILAGVAVIGGVVAARQPALRQTDSGTRTTVSMPAGEMVSGEHLVYNSVNDEQVNSSELEARFLSQGNQALSQNTNPTEIEPAPTAAEDMLVLAPNQSVTTEDESKSPEQLTAAEPIDQTEPENTVNSPAAAENTTVAWLNDKAYAVSLKAADEMGSAPAEHQSESVNVPVKVLDAAGNEKKQPQTTVFELDGKEYAIQLTELSPEETPAKDSAESVVWIDKTPLQVVLSGEPENARENESNAKVQMDLHFEITLNPLPAEQTAALQQERFGMDLTNASPAEENAIPTATTEPTPVVTEEPQEENWFASFFNNLFGSAPTEVPTPQVTVIAMTPTPTVPQPTATPLVIVMAPAAEAEGPVRLDGDGSPSAEPVNTPAAGSSSNAPAAPADDAGTQTEGKSTENNTADSKASGSEQTTGTQSTKAAPSKLDAVVVDSFDKDLNYQQTAQPTVEAKELPHTGGLEGWNIPSLLIMLAGLLLVIFGVRRLRSR